MKVLHVIPSLSPQWGGPVAVVNGLTEALHRRGVNNTVYSVVGRRVGTNPISLPHADTCLFNTGGFSRVWTAYSPGMYRRLEDAVSQCDVVHIHELWHYPGYAAYRAATSLGKPYIVRICGELEPWALGQSRWKKRLYMALSQRRILDRASSLHAITDQESLQIRALGFTTSTSVIPHGVDLDQFLSLPDAQEFRKRFPQTEGKLLVLFLGRLHPKKGLGVLARAFGSLARGRNDVCLVLAGPDEGGYRHELERMLTAEGVLDKVVIPGLLTGTGKLAALAAADVYILPSWSDVRGVATLEAMASGLPVIITPQCQFPEVAEMGAGLVVDPTPEQLSSALEYLLDHPSERECMAQQGRELIRQRFTWDAVARQVIDMYEKVIWTTHNSGNPV